MFPRIRSAEHRTSGTPKLASGNNVKAVRAVLHVYGTSDPKSTVDQVEHVVGLLPRAELHLMDRGGHLPWFDDPSQVGALVSRFLAG